MKSRFLDHIKARLEYIVVILLACVLVAIMVTIFRTPEYEGRARLLVIQKQDKIDAFAASKSADYVAGLLNEAIYTDTFYASVIAKDSSLASDFDSNPEKRAKEWAKKIDTNVIDNKGILSVKSYDESAEEAKHLTDVIVSVLVTEGASYHGGGSDITLRVVDAPTASEKPVRPSLAVNALTGLFVGLGVCVVYLLFVETTLKKGLEDQESLHPEMEESIDTRELSDGHFAATPAKHIVSESFGTDVEPVVPFADSVDDHDDYDDAAPAGPVSLPSEAPAAEAAPTQKDASNESDAHNRIQNWMQR